MSALQGHLATELLSAYLDRELDDLERPRIEDHLDGCVSCRCQLEGLRRVAETVQRLERAAPPPVLDALVKRQIVLERERGGLGLRGRSPLRGGGALSAQVGIMFALVFSLAIILYLFTSALERRSQVEPILVPILEPAGGEASREPALESRIAVGSRLFVRTDTGYRQLGAAGGPVRSLKADAVEVAELLEREPELRRLLGAGTVVMILEGEVVALVAEGPVTGVATERGE